MLLFDFSLIIPCLGVFVQVQGFLFCATLAFNWWKKVLTLLQSCASHLERTPQAFLSHLPTALSRYFRNQVNMARFFGL